MLVDTNMEQTDTNDAAEAWKEVVSQFRSLCLMRHEGKTANSKAILEQDLPRKIAVWSQTAEDDAEAKRVRLEQMFREEQKRIEDFMAFRELGGGPLQEQILSELAARVSGEIKSFAAEQAEASARLRNQLLQEIKDALAEQARQEAVRQEAQTAYLQSIEHTLAQVIHGLGMAALTGNLGAIHNIEGATSEPRAASSRFPTVVDRGEERAEAIRKPFGTRQRQRPLPDLPPLPPELLAPTDSSVAAA
jgi:hypothetical protein